MENSVHKDHVLEIFKAAVDAVHPSNIIPSNLSIKEGRFQVGEDLYPFDRFENIYVAGAGKAAAAMALETEKILSHHIREGVIATRDMFDFSLKYIRAIEGGHPLPNNNSLIAGGEIIKLLKKIKKNDLLIFLLSGGASSLLMDLPDGCALDDVNKMFDLLIKSGAAIHEVNIVRKHLSELKGGQLVRKCQGTTIVSFIISDVIGNDLQAIGSGPTVGDDSTYADAMNILEKYDLKKAAPYSIITHLQRGVEETIPPNPKPDDSIFRNTRNKIIADNKKALDAAKLKAEELGYEAHIITDSMNGIAEDAANDWARRAAALRRKNICMIAGGETTVHVKGIGKGGRNQQFALAAAIALKKTSEITVLAAGTDGSDGPTDAAGAIADSHTYENALKNGLVAEKYLENNDAYSFFETTGGLIKTGTTHTNVMDVVVALT